MKKQAYFILSVVTFLISRPALAQLKSKDFLPEQIQFTFMSTDGSTWLKCLHQKNLQPHQWVVQCADYRFNLHLFLNQYQRANESTFELNYWADEVFLLNETHTHSTWLTVDQKAEAKQIVSYLGFSKDTRQLRLEVSLK